jgi:hypothetical protein
MSVYLIAHRTVASQEILTQCCVARFVGMDVHDPRGDTLARQGRHRERECG